MKTLEQTNSRIVGIGILFGALVFLALAGVPRALQGAPGAVAKASPAWVLPRPPYPAAAMKTREQGKVIITITTDATGRVVEASAVPANQKDDLPNLTEVCVRWALTQWHGPPSTTRKIPLEFVSG